MESELIKTIIYVLLGGIVLFLIVRFTSKPKKCVVCRTDTKDVYKNKEGKDNFLCRNHLVEQWKKDVLSSSFEMVMIEPDFVAYPWAYLYATVEKLKEWEYPKSAQDVIVNALNSIKGQKCKDCGMSATVAFYKKEEYEFPFLENLKSPQTYLCKSCAIKKTESQIRSAKKDFIEGVYAPTTDRGIYHTQEF